MSSVLFVKAFITLKDHPTCRLINPAESELGNVCKQILDNIDSKIRKTAKLNQWKRTSDVTNWFTIGCVAPSPCRFNLSDVAPA